MANTTFSGPVRIGSGDKGTAWPASCAASVVLKPTANASTDFTVKLPKCRILRVTTGTDTAFTGTTATLQVGTSAGGSDIVAAASVKAAGTVAHTLVAANQDNTIDDGSTLYLRLAQTGPTAVGAGIVTIEFIPLA